MIWKCRDGRLIPIEDLETDHLKNIVAMLRRQGFVTPSEFFSCAGYAFSPMTGEYASMAAENELNRMTPWTGLEKLEEELNKRKGRRQHG